LLTALARERVVFVAGRVRQSANGLLVEPFGVVVERDGVRRMIQPWIEAATGAERADAFATATERLDPETFVRDELGHALGELLVTGVEGMTPVAARQWRDRARQAEALGFGRLPAHLDALAERPDATRALALAAMVCFSQG
jgi:hypothetical protein